MTCKEFNNFLDDQASPTAPALPHEAVEHLTQCRECRSLFQFFSTKSTGPELPAGLTGKIQAALLDSLRPVRPLPSGRAFLLASLAVFALLSLVGIGVMGTRAHQSMTVSQIVGMTCILIACAFLLTISLRWQMVPGSYQKISPLLLLIFIFAGLFGFMGLLFPFGSSDEFVHRGLVCWGAGLLTAVPAAAAFLWLVRRGAFLSRSTTGAILGSLIGLVGATTVQFNCSDLAANHLMVWHGGIVFACLLVGLVIGMLIPRRSIQVGS